MKNVGESMMTQEWEYLQPQDLKANAMEDHLLLSSGVQGRV